MSEHQYEKIGVNDSDDDEEKGLSNNKAKGHNRSRSRSKGNPGQTSKEQLMSVVVVPGGSGQKYGGSPNIMSKQSARGKGRNPFMIQHIRDEDDDFDDDEDDSSLIKKPAWGSEFTESWAKIGSHAIWVAYASVILGVVYICTGVISIGWREALDAFVTAFGMWLVACFLFRFRSAIVAMSNDEDFEQGMVRATKELHDIFHILKTLSILYLMRYFLVLVLFVVGMFGYIEKRGEGSSQKQ